MRDIAVEEERILKDQTYFRTNFLDWICLYRFPINQNIALLEFIKTQQHIDDRAFTAAGMPDQRYRFTRIGCKADAFQHILFPVIRERNIFKFDSALTDLQFRICGLIWRQFGVIQYTQDPGTGDDTVLQGAEVVHHHSHRTEEILDIGSECIDDPQLHNAVQSLVAK